MDEMDFIENWRNKAAGGRRRTDQSTSDVFWEKLYKLITSEERSEEKSDISGIDLIYRVHDIVKKPDKNKYEEFGEVEYYQEEMEKFEKYSNGKIDYDGHWSSFTKNVDVIGSSYFAGKQMRGTVVVMKPEKYIDISTITNQMGFAEDEVVTPMNRSNVVEELSFEQFMEKYGKGTSDFEKFGH